MRKKTMSSKRKIKISKIKNKILKIGSDLYIIESLARILQETIRNNENLKYQDNENLSMILKKEIICVYKRFNKIESILNI